MDGCRLYDLITPTADALLALVSSLDHIKIAPDTKYEGINNFFFKKCLINEDNQKQFAFTLQEQHTFTILP